VIKVLIADDDAQTRKTIINLLNFQTDIGEIIETANGNDVVNLCLLHSPDIIYLDIQIPGKAGINIANDIPAGPLIIISTANKQYATTAFELNAIDYLLKPFTTDRFYVSLNKARNQLININTPEVNSFSQVIKKMNVIQENQYKSRLVVKDPGRIRFIEIADINYISGAGNYADLFLLDGSHVLYRETLTALVNQLDPDVFMRIHRSSIVRRTSICELRSNDNGDYTVILKSGELLTLSRRNRDKFEALLQE
jgi:two-component system LytT family response regulator